jgi:hypothetical protein
MNDSLPSLFGAQLALNIAGKRLQIMAGKSEKSGVVAEVETDRPLRLQCSDCQEQLHELCNILTGVLMQAQVLDWKLPPYSHLKRSVRQLARDAHRGSELLKRLVRSIGGA